MQEKRGGKREGAGRKRLGITRKVSITLDQEDWDFIDSLLRSDSKVDSRSALFRFIYLSHFHPNSSKMSEFN